MNVAMTNLLLSHHLPIDEVEVDGPRFIVLWTRYPSREEIDRAAKSLRSNAIEHRFPSDASYSTWYNAPADAHGP